MGFDRLLLSARESQQLNSKDFYKLVVKSLVAWNLPRWEHIANTTNQVIFSFIFFLFFPYFIFASREPVYQHDLHFPKVLVGEHYSRSELLQVGGRKVWCTSLLNAMETSCRRREEEHLCPRSENDWTPPPISNATLWNFIPGITEMLCPGGMDIPPHSKMHLERLGRSQGRILYFSWG